MIVIIEGCDRTGKSTLSQLLQNHFAHLPLIPMHTMPLKTDDEQIKKMHMKALYESVFRTLLSSFTESFIFDRFHLGEMVYAPKYRNMNGEYAVLMDKVISHLSDCFLFLLEDTVENLLKREDGRSFSISVTDKHDEMQRFRDAFTLSSIKNKRIINVTDKDQFTVFLEAVKFITGKS